MFHVIVKANLIVLYAIHIKSKIMINVNIGVKKVSHVQKKIILRILTHVLVRIVGV